LCEEGSCAAESLVEVFALKLLARVKENLETAKRVWERTWEKVRVKAMGSLRNDVEIVLFSCEKLEKRLKNVENELESTPRKAGKSLEETVKVRAIQKSFFPFFFFFFFFWSVNEEELKMRENRKYSDKNSLLQKKLVIPNQIRGILKKFQCPSMNWKSSRRRLRLNWSDTE
jgi:hypothetical protein